ncbi:MAG: arylesterase [Burkholderiales bacterium]
MLRILVFAFSLFAGAAAAAPAIMVYGDSLSAAYGLPKEAGWVTLLEDRLRQGKYDYDVINASISGETTLGGRNRIVEALKKNDPAVVILELGANDGLRGQSLDSARSNLASIIETANKRGARILLLGMRLPPNYGTAYGDKFQSMYRDLAARHKLALVPFLLEGFADRREYFQSDGVHPTAEAQRMILENVWKELQPLLKR